ncbi:MAG TPA: tRNA lysidine(34) synthetase TilS [Xanthobacteraceae bacterium]
MSAAKDAQPVSAAEANKLFKPLARASALVLAVSGGADSTALLVLAERWRAARKTGPTLVAVTIDHGLRPVSAAEARAVKRLARRLGVRHRTLRWSGQKPKTGLQQAARIARYGLLAAFARTVRANHILTAHTLDDQAETVLIRMCRGSGISGLGGMRSVTSLAVTPSSTHAARRTLSRSRRSPGLVQSCSAHPLHPAGGPMRPNLQPTTRGDKAGGELLLVRPFLGIAKARLIATLQAADIPHVEDASNRDPRFARSRLRELMPALARQGLDAGRLALFARRVQRAETALEAAVDVAAARVARRGFANAAAVTLDAGSFFKLPQEIAVRLLARSLAQTGDEGQAQLGKLEALYETLATAREAGSARLRRTLAGAMVTLNKAELTVETAPPRRRGPIGPQWAESPQLVRK